MSNNDIDIILSIFLALFVAFFAHLLILLSKLFAFLSTPSNIDWTGHVTVRFRTIPFVIFGESKYLMVLSKSNQSKLVGRELAGTIKTFNANKLNGPAVWDTGESLVCIFEVLPGVTVHWRPLSVDTHSKVVLYEAQDSFDRVTSDYLIVLSNTFHQYSYFFCPFVNCMGVLECSGSESYV